MWAASTCTRGFLHRYMPTNAVLDKLRTRRGLKWGVSAMLLAIPYLAVANIMTILIGRGEPGWFHLLALLCIYNAFKFLVMGPVIVPERKRRLDGVDQVVLSLTARDLVTGEIAARFEEVYGVKVSRGTISRITRITEKASGELTGWVSRPWGVVYAVFFVDVIVGVGPGRSSV